MSLALSRTQIEKLGKRLVAADRPRPEDVELLNELLISYREVLSAATLRVERVTGLQPTSRVKTRGTTIDKLRKQGGHRLSAIQDLAGMRVVVRGTRDAQDAVVEQVVREFSAEDKPPNIVDRRESPSSGYRAVHVVVFPGKVPVEVQVRTHWQHEWADLYEKLGDRVGRQIRYGGQPELHEFTPTGEEGKDRVLVSLVHARLEWERAMVEWAQAVAEVLAAAEVAEQNGNQVPTALWEELRQDLATFRNRLSEHGADVDVPNDAS